jgi:AAA+ ATPase superfamily predicted ATPase
VEEDQFPAKLAEGEQFCNRHKERKLLISNVKKARHSVLISPRRYGKSSLVHYVINELNMPYATVDLFLAYDDQAVTKRLLAGISQAVSAILPVEARALKRVQELFGKFKTSIGIAGFNIELAYETEFDAVDQIFSALDALAKLAAKEKKPVLFFINEFQDVAAAESAKAIQGAIRHVAQATNHVVFIFSGSNRHLLLELFDDKSLPLYMLCDKLYLERIHSKDYRPHLNKFAKERWKKELPENVFKRIMALAELHPFYVNLLCNKLWKGCFPNEQAVEEAWQLCIDEETRRVRAELEKLSRNQQSVLKALAKISTKELTGKDFVLRSGVAPSSLFQTVKVLFEKGMIFKVEITDDCAPLMKKDFVRVLDPLIASYLRQLG